jgi:class 3 adenylate cyclase/pimeloyl-ACP methyl ester carboxylesterase
MDRVPETGYAYNGDLAVAYQVLSDGPMDVLVFSGAVFPMDCLDEEPLWEVYYRRFAAFARVVRFDRRGIGFSDSQPLGAPLTLDDWVQDTLAVLDAVPSERAALVTFENGGSLTALAFAAAHPDRVSSLVILNGSARTAWAPDYPSGFKAEEVEQLRETLADGWTDASATLALAAPSLAPEDRDRVAAWFARGLRRGSSPTRAQIITQMVAESDVRGVLPAVHAPALVVHTQFGPSPDDARYLAERLPNATLVSLADPDFVLFGEAARPFLDRVEEFLTGLPAGSDLNRMLVTILFTDIVDSTRRATTVGDRAWEDRLNAHDAMVRRQLVRFKGREIKTMGDGFLATFDGPTRAVQCASAICEGARQLGIDVRAGLHTGEIELRDDDIGGRAVNIGARVIALAESGEVLVSRTVVDLVGGSGIEFEDRGEHELKGVPGTWTLYAVIS